MANLTSCSTITEMDNDKIRVNWRITPIAILLVELLDYLNMLIDDQLIRNKLNKLKNTNCLRIN